MWIESKNVRSTVSPMVQFYRLSSSFCPGQSLLIIVKFRILVLFHTTVSPGLLSPSPILSEMEKCYSFIPRVIKYIYISKRTEAGSCTFKTTKYNVTSTHLICLFENATSPQIYLFHVSIVIRQYRPPKRYIN